MQECRDLAEEAPLFQRRELLVLEDDPDFAVDDDVEPDVLVAPPHNPLALVERDLVDVREHHLELIAVEIGEEREPRDALNQIGIDGHCANPIAARSRFRKGRSEPPPSGT